MSDTTLAGTDAGTDNALAVYQGLLQPVPLASTAGETATSLSFIAFLTVNDKPVPIESGNLLKLAEEGIEFSLPKGTKIELGTLQLLVNWFCTQMQLQPPDWTTLPAALQKITSAATSIDTLYVKANKANVQFDIAVSLDFGEGWTIVGNLKLQKFTFRLARVQPEKPPAPPA